MYMYVHIYIHIYIYIYINRNFIANWVIHANDCRASFDGNVPAELDGAVRRIRRCPTSMRWSMGDAGQGGNLAITSRG